MKKIILTLALLSIVPLNASALSAQELRNACKEYKEDPRPNVFCTGYVEGYFDAMLISSMEINKDLLCLTKPITEKETVDIFNDYIDSYTPGVPKKLYLPAVKVLTKALQREFCNPE